MLNDFSTYAPVPVLNPTVGFESKNIVEEGYGNLPEQFKEKPNITGLLITYLEGVQETENLISKILVDSELDTAYGIQLDMLGAIFGSFRQGKTDEDFRQDIEARIAVITSSGTPNDIISIFKVLTTSNQVSIHEHYPASFSIAALMPEPNFEGEGHVIGGTPIDIAEIVKSASPLGVGPVTTLFYLDDNAKLGEITLVEGTVVLDNPLQPDDPNTPEDERDDFVVVSDGSQPLVTDFLEYQEKSSGSDLRGLGVLAEIIAEGAGFETAPDVIDNWIVVTEFGTDNLTLVTTNNPQNIVGGFAGTFAEVLVSGN